MVKAELLGLIETCMRGNIKMGKDMLIESTLGLMGENG